MMLNRAGRRARAATLLLLQMIQACGEIPDHWRMLLATLLLKPGLPAHEILSYRTVVLAEILSKGLEKVVMTKYKDCLLKHPIHACIMAYREGISTGVTIFVITEATMEAQLSGTKVVIMANDIKFAFNTTDRRRVEVLEWDMLRFRGQMWELSRQLAGPVRYRTKFHGHLTEPMLQNGGYAQGKVSSGEHFNTGMHTWATDVQRAGGGVEILGRTILGACSSDDTYVIVEEHKLNQVSHGCENSMRNNLMQAKPDKQYLMYPGRPRNPFPKSTEVKNPDWYCNWAVQHPTATFGGEPYTVRHSAKVLGRLIGPRMNRHPKQAEWARKKGIGAMKFLGWMGAFSNEVDHHLAKILVTYLVNSVTVSSVLNTQLSDADLIELRKPQAHAARRASRAGQRVAQLAILRELGWTPIDTLIWSSKLGLHETLKNLPKREYGRTVLDARMVLVSVQIGRDDRGLCAETKQFWESVNHPDAWTTANNESKAARRRRLRLWIEKRLDIDWTKWCGEQGERNGDYHLLCPQKGHAAEHLNAGSKKQIGLMITARCGALIVRGNKTAEKHATPHDKSCTLHPNPELEPEDEGHVLLACPEYDEFRQPMMEEMRSEWSPEQSELYDGSNFRYKKLYLLGLSMGDGDSDDSRRHRDLLVKTFLEQVNEHRKSKLDLVDLCGKAPRPAACSMREAFDWSQEAKAALQGVRDYLDDTDESSDSDI